MTPRKIPYLPIVVSFCLAAIVGYAAFSVYVVFYMKDPTMIGDTVGTWKSFAVGAFGFWIGSSSAGKAKDETPPTVQIQQPPGNPVPTVEAPDVP